MKYFLLKSILPVAAALLWLTSCIKDQTAPLSSEDGQPAELVISTRSIYADDADGGSGADNPDNLIGTLRVMAFDLQGGIRSNKLYDNLSNSTITHKMTSGTYDFVIVANEPASRTATLNAVASYAGICAVNFPASAFNETDPIPMVCAEGAVKVLAGTDGVRLYNGTGVQKPWDIALDRLAVRFDMVLQSELTPTLKSVTFTRLPDNVPVLGTAYQGSTYSSRTYTVGTDVDRFETGLTPEAGKKWAAKVVRVILPAHVFADAENAANASKAVLTLSDNSQYEHEIYHTEKVASSPLYGKKHYNLCPNANFVIAGTITTRGFDMEANVVPWNEVGITANDGLYYLYVSKGLVELDYAADSNEDITLTTNHSGWAATVYSDEALTSQLTGTANWLTITPNTSLSKAESGTTVNIKASANSGAIRTAYVKFKAGNMVVYVKVIQDKELIPYRFTSAASTLFSPLVQEAHNVPVTVTGYLPANLKIRFVFANTASLGNAATVVSEEVVVSTNEIGTPAADATSAPVNVPLFENFRPAMVSGTYTRNPLTDLPPARNPGTALYELNPRDIELQYLWEGTWVAYDGLIRTQAPIVYAGHLEGNLLTKTDGGITYYKFEHELWVQALDASAGVKWKLTTGTLLGPTVTNDWYGRDCTYNLANIPPAGEYAAANVCYTKNRTTSSAADLTWYLPAQRQLMAVYAVQETFGAYKFSMALDYFTATEVNASRVRSVYFLDGYADYLYKASILSVRCVRNEEVTR